MEQEMEVNFENIYKTMAERNENRDAMNRKLLNDSETTCCSNVVDCFYYCCCCFIFYN